MRTGKITASRCYDVMVYTEPEYYVDNATNQKKGIVGELKNNPGFGETAKSYAKELALARMGYEPDGFTSWEMEWGIEHEADAREIYERSRGIQCELPGFIEWKEDPENVGCTPDGKVGSDGLIEIKCPQWKAHFDYLTEGAPDNYWKQMQFQMMVTGTKWCDFMTFHPDFPEGLQAKVFRIERDQEFIDLLTDRIVKFKVLIQSYVDKLSTL